ncbi:MAG: sialidase family protein [Anaerolineales bacterium]
MTWQPLKRLTWTTGQTEKVSVASDSPGNTYMVYNDDSPGNYEIFLKKSPSGCATWLPPQRLTWTAGDSKFPVLEISSATTLHVAWCESSSGYFNIFYKSSIDGGISWSPPRRLTWNALEAADPNITIDSNGHIYIVWYDWSSTNIDVFLKKSTDGGSSWSALQRVTWNSGYSCRPVIGTSSPAAIHIAWYDNTPGNYEIFYKKSTDGGATWIINNRVTWSTENSNDPDMAVVTSTNQVHLTWQESLSPDSEIFYKKSQMIIIGENNK